MTRREEGDRGWRGRAARGVALVREEQSGAVEKEDEDRG